MKKPLFFTLIFAGALAGAPAHAQLALRQSDVVQGSYSTIGNLLIDWPEANAAGFLLALALLLSRKCRYRG